MSSIENEFNLKMTNPIDRLKREKRKKRESRVFKHVKYFP
jgi:hypothetical protein